MTVMLLNAKIILALTIAGQLGVHGLAQNLFQDTAECEEEGLPHMENNNKKISTLGLYKEIIDLKEIVQKQGTVMQTMQEMIFRLEETTKEQAKKLGEKDQILNHYIQKQTAADIFIKELTSEISGMNWNVKLMEMEIMDLKEIARNKDMETEAVKDELLGQKKIVEKPEGFMSKKNDKSLRHKAMENQTTGNNGVAQKEYERNSSAVLQSDVSPQSFENIQTKENPIEKSILTPRAIITGGVGFSTYLSKSIQHMGNGHTIKLDQVLLNDGNGYNAFTGIFTVPRSGVYLLTFTINVYNKDFKTEVRLVKNNLNIIDAVAWPTGQGHDTMGGNSALIRLTQGEAVWLENYHQVDSEIISNTGYRYTAFSGVLLYS